MKTDKTLPLVLVYIFVVVATFFVILKVSNPYLKSFLIIALLGISTVYKRKFYGKTK